MHLPACDLVADGDLHALCVVVTQDPGCVEQNCLLVGQSQVAGDFEGEGHWVVAPQVVQNFEQHSRQS